MLKYDKICSICGKSFVSDFYGRKYCSKSCAKVAIRRRHDIKPKFCATCGKQLADYRQTWCLDCLLKDYEKTHSSVAYHRLCNRGFDRDTIIQELKNRR